MRLLKTLVVATNTRGTPLDTAETSPKAFVGFIQHRITDKCEYDAIHYWPIVGFRLHW